MSVVRKLTKGMVPDRGEFVEEEESVNVMTAVSRLMRIDGRNLLPRFDLNLRYLAKRIARRARSDPIYERVTR